MDYLQYLKKEDLVTVTDFNVLNLVINGLPSILNTHIFPITSSFYLSFKPCYKWITFNTKSFQK